MVKKALAFVLSLAMIATMTPVVAFAANDEIKNASNVKYYTEEKTLNNGKTVTVNSGVKSFDYYFKDEDKTRHYTDVSGNKATTLDAKSIKNILTSDYDGKGTLLERWANVGSAIMSYGSGINEHKYSYVGQDSYSDDFKPGVSNSGHRVDVKKYLGLDAEHSQGSLGDDSVRTTGLVNATSLNQVRDAAGKLFADLVDKDMATQEKALDRKDLDEALPDLKNSNSTQAYYSLVGSMKEPSCNKRKINIYGICFYDFQVREIADDNIEFVNAAAGYDSYQEASTDSSTGVYYDVNEELTSFNQVNKSAMEAGYDATTTTNHTETLHSTVSQSYEFEEENSLGSEAMIRIGGEESPASAEFTFSYGYRWQETWGSSEEYEVEKGTENERTQTTHIDMPAHTSLTINHRSSDVEYTLPYSAPVEVLYKVVVFNLSGDIYADNTSIYYNNTAEYKTADSTIFFGTESTDGVGCAADSLGDRWENRDINGYDDGLGTCYRYYHYGTNTTNTSKNGLKMSKLATDSDNGNITDVIEGIDFSRPILTQGGELSKTGIENTSEIEELEALYPIDKVVINDSSNTTGSYNVLNGCSMSLPTGVFQAIDVEGAEFYDFMEALGHWTIKSGSDIVSLDHDFDKEGIKAANVSGLKTGTAVLRWEFDDPDYVLSSVNGDVRAGDVKSMPEIGVNVVNSSIISTESEEVAAAADEPIAGDFKFKTSDKTAAAAGEPISINKLAQLTGVINGKRVNVYTDLEVSKKPVKPADVDPDDYDDSDWYSSSDGAGKVTFTGPGTYTITARIGNELLTAPVKVGGEREIVNAAFAKKKIGVTGATSVNISSFLKVKDQYGKMWTMDEWKDMNGSKDSKFMFKVKGPAKTMIITKQTATNVLGKDTKAFVTPEITPGKYTIEAYKDGKKLDSLKVNVKKMPGTKVKSLKGGKESVKVSLSKQTNTVDGKHVSGYQIRYSKNKAMSGAKILTVKGYKNTVQTIKNLDAGKKYYVQARTYMLNKNMKICSKWSEACNIKTEK